MFFEAPTEFHKTVNPKIWFNIDLMDYALRFSLNNKEFIDYFENNYCRWQKIQLTFEQVKEAFKNVTTDDFNNFVLQVIELEKQIN